MYHLSVEWRIFSLYILLFNHLFASFVQWDLSIFTPRNSFQIHHLLLPIQICVLFFSNQVQFVLSIYSGIYEVNLSLATVFCLSCSTTFYYYIIFLKKHFFSFYICILVPIPHRTFYLLYTFPPPQPSIHNSESVRFPMENHQCLTHHLETGQRPSSCPFLGWARYASKTNGLKNASSSTINKPWPHFQKPQRLLKPHNLSSGPS